MFKKNDLKEAKPDWSLFPMDAGEAVVRILMMGEKKYGRDNWRDGLNDVDAQRRIFSAMLRHLTLLQRGETLDQESGEHHMLHVACNALFLSAFAETHKREAEEFNDILNVDLTDDGSVGEHVGENLECGDPTCFCAVPTYDPTEDRAAVEDTSGMDTGPGGMPTCDNPTCQICY